MNEYASRKWNSTAFAIAAICLLVLALMQVTGLESPAVTVVLIIGILFSGTIALVVQARQPCPECGTTYGYRLRLGTVDRCRTCGHEFGKERD